eukprot:49612_1
MAAKKGTKAVKVHGTCGLQMQKCVCNLSRYNCASCHAVDTKDYLIKLPQYKPNSAKQCNWTGARKSYTRHSKRYHNTKKDHFHGFKPNKQKQSTRQPLREAHTESNRNEKNKKKRKINCILDTKKKTNPPFKFRKLNANSSSDARKMKTEEELIHATLFDTATDKEIGNIKRVIDVSWISQPYEGYAETIAKLVGLLFDPLRMSTGFEKLKIRTLCKMWLPPVKQREQLLDDMTKLLLCEGVRGIKLDERSQIGSVAYNNRVRKSKQNAVPYD